jgi:outer membrane receptor protein involved in Fe transport
VNAYEIGAKAALWGDRLKLSTAAFFNDYRNQQVNFLRSEVTALGPFPVNILDNVPKARTRGLEAEADLAVTSRLDLQASAGLLDARYARGAAIAGLDLNHNRLPYAPTTSGSVGLRWRAATLAGEPVIVSPSLVYSGRYFFDPTNNPNVGTQGFVRANGTVSWQRQGLALSAWVQNLFNERYDNYGVDLSGNTGFYFYSAAPPRTFGLSAARSF